jgi:hypothetical protein
VWPFRSMDEALESSCLAMAQTHQILTGHVPSPHHLFQFTGLDCTTPVPEKMDEVQCMHASIHLSHLG